MGLIAFITFSLGQWQNRRADEKAGLQALAERAAKMTPLAIGATPQAADAVADQAVIVQGRFVPQATVFIDNRTHQGVAGFHVLTPLRIEAGAADAPALHVMVLRGWVARDALDRNRLPVIPTPEQSIEIGGVAERALARTLELKAALAPAPGERLWQNFDPLVFQAWSGLQLQPFIVRQSPASAIDDKLVRQWRAAGNDVQKHHGYAVQWFAMSAAAAAVVLYLILFVRRAPPKASDAV